MISLPAFQVQCLPILQTDEARLLATTLLAI